MKTYEKFFLHLVFGGIVPITLFLTTWWSTFALHATDMQIGISSITGLLLGIVLDFFFLSKLVKQAFQLPQWVLMATYVFYSFLILGFFMGMPIFNIAMTIVGGFFVGRQSFFLNENDQKKSNHVKYFAVFSTIVLLIVFACSATAALLSPSTGSEVAHMLGLNSPFSLGALWGIIIFGGATLLVLNYFLAIKTITRVIDLSRQK